MLSHRGPRSTRFGKSYVSARRIIFACLFAAVTVLYFSSPAHAQGGVPLVTIATDQSSLNLITQFGVPAVGSTAINQKGDLAFVGTAGSALFFRAGGATSVTRLLQVGDPVPGFANSQILHFHPTIGINSAASLLFEVSFSLSDALPHEALLTFDGANYHTVASSEDAAAGSTGLTYGTSLVPIGINDRGDVAFEASPAGVLLTAIYIVPSKGAAKRIVGVGDPSPFPAFSGGPIPILSIMAQSGLNALGQVLVNLDTNVYLASISGVSAVQMPGTPSCGPLFAGPQSAILNNAGSMALFSTAGICIVPASGTPVTILAGAAAPAQIGGTIGPPSLRGFNDAGDVVFTSFVSPSSANTFAVLRYNFSTSTIDAVAYEGEPAPGTTDNIFSLGSAVSIANNGMVSFQAKLIQGGNAIYQQVGAQALPVLLAIDGQPAPQQSGATLKLFAGTTMKTLDNGATLFDASTANGPPYYTLYLGSPGNLHALMGTNDALPAGYRMTLTAGRPQAAGHFVAFAAQFAGGPIGIFVSDLSKGTTTRVATRGDPAPGTGGFISAIDPNIYINAGGQVALLAPVFAGTSPKAIFIWSPGSGLSKVVAEGDTSPLGSAPFAVVALSLASPSPLNNAGQLAFYAIVAGQPPLEGAFFYDPQASISKIAVSGDGTPNGGTFTAISGQTLGLNSAGQLALLGSSTRPVPNSSGSFTVESGIYVGSPGSAPQQVALTGSPLSAGEILGFPVSLSGFGPAGLTFTGLSVSSSGILARPQFGVFTAQPGNPINDVAVSGGATPLGGTFSLDTPVVVGGNFVTDILVTDILGNIASSNDEGDGILRAGINGGSADSGYFRFSQSGTPPIALQKVVSQGDAVPGGGIFNTILLPGTEGAGFALGPDGALAFVNTFTANAAGNRGAFVSSPDNVLLRVLASGDTVPGGGTLSALSLKQGMAAGDPGKFTFWAGIQGGSAQQAIFVTAIPAGIAATTTTVRSTQSPAVSGQPVMLMASVNSAVSGTASGSVGFFDNGVSLGVETVGAGQAALDTSALQVGAHSIVAQYSGDTNFAASNSAALAVDVVGFASPPANLAVIAGQSLMIPLTLYGAAGLNLQFTLSCSGLPADATCAFGSNPVTPAPPPNGTPIQVTLSTKAASASIPADPRSRPWPSGGIGLAIILSLFLGTAMAGSRLSPRRLVLTMGLAVFSLTTLLTGCSAGPGSNMPSGSPGTPRGSAAITITATSGATVINTVVTVTVQ